MSAEPLQSEKRGSETGRSCECPTTHTHTLSVENGALNTVIKRFANIFKMFDSIIVYIV